MFKIRSAVIAAAGLATRMWPASKVVPKELFPLGKMPAIAHIVCEMLDAGIERIVVVAAPHNSAFLRTLFDPSKVPPAKVAGDSTVIRFQDAISTSNIEVIEQHEGYGNGTPLKLGIRHLGAQPCIYAFGDDVVIGENAATGLMGVYERTGQPVLGAQEVAPERKSSFGILECEARAGELHVKRVLEKPAQQDTHSNLASFGRYVVTIPVLDRLESVKPGRDGEIWFIDAVIAHLRQGGDACAFCPTGGAWYTVGDPQSYAEAVRAERSLWL